ncbi:hypothetical protein RFI_27157 [Reticulomyxa filosa]|uniref:Uncharacterized protein n=1 Tax=Reticulomyxa filosa TaxID=46433 RepID=X6M993_RETFI|nr:hypothetical protein RFI_27157 [Reticulomyxa filosa]|eukprot:ETO10221.1 hypothetical protein RFI_27157 [Reticulomyxa filosa]
MYEGMKSLFIFILSGFLHCLTQATPIVQTTMSRGTVFRCANESNTSDCLIYCSTEEACYKSVMYCPTEANCTIVCSGPRSCYGSIIHASTTKRQETSQVRFTFELRCNGTESCSGIELYVSNSHTVKIVAQEKKSLQGYKFELSNIDKVEIDCNQSSACKDATTSPSLAKFVHVRNVSIQCVGDMACFGTELVFDESPHVLLHMRCDGNVACKTVINWPAPRISRDSNNDSDTSSCPLQLYAEEGYTGGYLHLQCNETSHYSCQRNRYHCGYLYEKFCDMTYTNHTWACVGNCASIRRVTSLVLREKPDTIGSSENNRRADALIIGAGVNSSAIHHAASISTSQPFRFLRVAINATNVTIAAITTNAALASFTVVDTFKISAAASGTSSTVAAAKSARELMIANFRKSLPLQVTFFFFLSSRYLNWPNIHKIAMESTTTELPQAMNSYEVITSVFNWNIPVVFLVTIISGLLCLVGLLFGILIVFWRHMHQRSQNFDELLRAEAGEPLLTYGVIPEHQSSDIYGTLSYRDDDSYYELQLQA